MDSVWFAIFGACLKALLEIVARYVGQPTHRPTHQRRGGMRLHRRPPLGTRRSERKRKAIQW
jgi:hypothetical protein